MAGETILFQPYPLVSWGAFVGLVIAGATGIWHFVRILYRHRNAVARGAKIVSTALEENSSREENEERMGTVSSAILQYLAAQERRDIAERQTRETRETHEAQEENRRWERVEALTLSLKDQAAALQTVMIAVQNASKMQQQSHQFHAQQIGELRDNQVKLSDWLRENWHRYPRASGLN